MMRKWQLKSAGFTLLEVLVTVAVVGILSSLLLVALSGAKADSLASVCQNHLRQMGLALKMYTDDHRSEFPFYVGPPGPSYGDAVVAGGRGNGMVYWSSKLFPYYPINWTNSKFHCPGYKGTNGNQINHQSLDRYGSYAYNVWGCYSALNKFASNTHGIGPVMFWGLPPITERRLAAPSQMISIGESRWLTSAWVKLSDTTSVDEGPGGMDTLECGYLERILFDPARHGRNYNFLLSDGHIGSMRPTNFFNPTNTAAMWNYDHLPHPELW